MLLLPPEKPPRLYLPLSLSEWDLRARGKSTTLNGDVQQQQFLTRMSRQRSTSLALGSNRSCKSSNWSTASSSERRRSIVPSIAEDWFISISIRPELNRIESSNQRSSMLSAVADDRTSIASSTMSAPAVSGSPRNPLTYRILSHSRSLAKMLNFRLRSKSSAKWTPPKSCDCQGQFVPTPRPPLGEHTAWLRSQGIEGNVLDEERPKRSNGLRRQRSKSAGSGQKSSRKNSSQSKKMEEPTVPTILVVNQQDLDEICTRL